MKRARPIVVLTAVFALLAWWWQPTGERAFTGTVAPHEVHDSSPPTEQLGADASEVAPSTVAARRLSRAVPVVQHVPLPADALLAQQIRYWKAAAQSGQPAAQCQWARFAQGCAWSTQSMTPAARTRYEHDNQQALDRGEIPDCRNISRNETDPAFEALISAAEKGHQPSQFLFAAGVLMPPMPDMRRIEHVRRYRDHAGKHAWRAFSAGDSDAAVLLWRAYNRVDADYLFLTGTVEPDPVKAHALDLLMNDLVPGFVVGTAAEAGLGAEQRMQAEAIHAEWRGQQFAHRKPPRFGMRIEEMFDWKNRAIDLCAPDSR